MNTRREWAAAYIAAARGPVPAYGSPEWESLPHGPDKIASVVRAAECWALDAEQVAERLAIELEALRRAEKQADDAEYVARRDDHRERWTGQGFRRDPRLTGELEAEFRAWAGGAA